MKALHRISSVILILAIVLTVNHYSFAQKDSDTAYNFEAVVDVPVTSVKDQHRSGTCWAFAGISFFEAEALRISGIDSDLSEMFIVRKAYEQKGLKYVRLHGSSNFGAGGQGHDVNNVIMEHGLLSEDTYPGLEIGEEKHNHGEIDAVLQGFLDAVIKRRGGKLSPVWFDAYKSILDVYLGEIPEDFDAKAYTSKLGIIPDGYIEITSYSIYPFYENVLLEVPDNWSDDLYYNIPLDEMLEVMEYALNEGYSVCWDGDVSDRGFSHKNGVAIVPDKDVKSLKGTERDRWENLSESEKSKELYNFKKPGDEKEIDQAYRQEHFDNYSSTDDHLMHLTGIVKDQNGIKYFVTKNSWDDDSNEYGGYLNMSESYVRLHTVAIMVHKDAVPEKIAEKLGL